MAKENEDLRRNIKYIIQVIEQEQKKQTKIRRTLI